MRYPELQSYLEEREIYTNRLKEINRGGETIVGLYQYVPPIIHQKRIASIREVLPNGFRADWFPNISEIRITKIT